MRVVTDLPRRVRRIDHTWIPLADGTRLGARIWLPEDAERDPVPAVLEYLPYRKGDGTAPRDESRHSYVAGHGYAVLRVDMRGSGESDGLLHDEYLPQEQEDALQVLSWIAAQPWCTGACGMFGISWGGFNGLQVAARRPPELRAVISLCSTDDRYADDVHYRGGAVLALEMLSWGASMLSYNAIAPDKEVAGPGWREAWLRRIDSVEPYEYEWLLHQRRDDYWKRGSVCEDFGAIECPVYAIGGWADGYSEAVLRLVAGLGHPSKGLLGPWSHAFPDEVEPGPAIGFLQECIRWWDAWLKGVDNGMADEPVVRAWMQEPVAPAPRHRERPGRWVAERSWPSQEIEERPLALGDGTLTLAPGERGSGPRRLEISTDLLCGLDSGVWCADGSEGDAPVDQRADDGRALSFTSAPLPERIELLGNARVELELESNKPVAQLTARLCDVAPDGSSLLITRGVLNLTHRDDHEHPQPLVPGQPTRVAVELDGIAQAIPAGHRLRLALSPAYWPWLWPAPELVTLAVHTEPSRLVLPVRAPRAEDDELRAFEEPEGAPPLVTETLEEDTGGRTLQRDFATGRTELTFDWATGGRYRIVDSGLIAGCWASTTYAISPADPLSAEVRCRATTELARDGWQTRAVVNSAMTCDAKLFRIDTRLEAFEDGERVRLRVWTFEVPRELG
jgi:putative CocE/NonD family hydrolase